MKSLTSLLLVLILVACQAKTRTTVDNNTTEKLTYAKGFSYEKHPKYIKIIVKKPYKGATTPYEYIIIKGDTVIKATHPNQVVIHNSIKKIIATSTTQIPIFEALNSEHLIKGYPNTDFISSPKTRKLIDTGAIVDLGHEEHMNTELALDIQPDILFSFAVNSLNKNYHTLKKAGIPIVIDASWLEESPLGRAEWIKFFALFLDKEEAAEIVFKQIESNYLTTLNKISKERPKPTVLCGSIFNSIWYTPAGESYIAEILQDAHTNYLWKNTKGTGSLSLPFEEVYLIAKNADYWIAPDNATSKALFSSNNKHYSKFRPYQTNKIYTYANTRGATGGLLFFELGALRPDLILQDFIKICHPEVLPSYETTFFKRLD